MKRISRRQALVGGGAAVAAGTVVMPRGAKAAGELTVWWTQGFYKAENDAVVAWMADWDKRNNTVAHFHDFQISPMLGVNYKLLPQVAFYANRTNSFSPNAQASAEISLP